MTGRARSAKVPFQRQFVVGGATHIKLEQLAALVLHRSPLGGLVRWVAGIRASLHTKLLGGFLIVTLLFVMMAIASLLAQVSTTPM